MWRSLFPEGAMGSTSDEGTTRATAWLNAWDAQGIHRTGTVGDEAGADWLAHEAAGLGAAPAMESFALDRLDPGETYLECAGMRISGLPLFDAPATARGGVSGALGPIGSDAAIAVAELPPLSVHTPDFAEM